MFSNPILPFSIKAINCFLIPWRVFLLQTLPLIVRILIDQNIGYICCLTISRVYSFGLRREDSSTISWFEIIAFYHLLTLILGTVNKSLQFTLMVLSKILLTHRVIGITLVFTKRIQIIDYFLTCVNHVCVNDIYVAGVFWIEAASLRLVQSIKFLQSTKFVCTYLCERVSGLKWIHLLRCHVLLLWHMLNTINECILLTKQLLYPFVLFLQFNEVYQQTFQPPPALCKWLCLSFYFFNHSDHFGTETSIFGYFFENSRNLTIITFF